MGIKTTAHASLSGKAILVRATGASIRRCTSLVPPSCGPRRSLRTAVHRCTPAVITAALTTTPPGIGSVTAATTLVAWSHPGRVRNKAAYASLAGVSPLPVPSGNSTRHRLNRGGDRPVPQSPFRNYRAPQWRLPTGFRNVLIRVLSNRTPASQRRACHEHRLSGLLRESGPRASAAEVRGRAGTAAETEPDHALAHETPDD